jgi:hypothetical protein
VGAWGRDEVFEILVPVDISPYALGRRTGDRETVRLRELIIGYAAETG